MPCIQRKVLQPSVGDSTEEQDRAGVICSHRCLRASLVAIDLELALFTLTVVVAACPLSALINPSQPPAPSHCHPSIVTP